jgi:hypothetical protein
LGDGREGPHILSRKIGHETQETHFGSQKAQQALTFDRSLPGSLLSIFSEEFWANLGDEGAGLNKAAVGALVCAFDGRCQSVFSSDSYCGSGQKIINLVYN